MSRLVPWKHQLEAEKAVTDAYRRGLLAALMVMATGLGKNLTSALAYRRFRRSMQHMHGRSRILFLAHQSDLLDQAQETFKEMFKTTMTYGSFNGVAKEPRETAVFATFQSMDHALFGRQRGKRRTFSRRSFDYIVVDESHHSHAHTYRRVIRYFKPQFMLGMTATPDRTDLLDIREIYGEEVYSLPLEEGLAKGLLTPVDYRLVTDGLHDLSILNTPIGKLSVKRLNKTLFIPRRDKEIARIITRHIQRVSNPRTMVFCPSIRYCDRLVGKLPNAVAIHSQLPDREQTERLKEFRAGDYDTVLTVDKFNEGIDIPDANIIVFLRSTAARIIFLQQLGRGLRKIRGKKRVLVLDFAGNCQRLQMINKLWTDVGNIKRPGSGRTKDPAVSVDIGTVMFSQTAQKILRVLDQIKIGYTKELLIAQLRRLKRQLGRIPMQADINEASKRGECGSTSALNRVFGSLAEAQRAAGMKPFYADTTPEALLDQLKQLQHTLGRVPKKEDIEAASARGECASATSFTKPFGSLALALQAAGMTPTRRSQSFGGKPKKADLVAQLQRLREKVGRVPTGRDINAASKRGEIVNSDWIRKAFGSVMGAHRAAGMTPYITRNISPALMVGQLRSLKRRLGRVPTVDDINEASKRRECVSYSSLIKKFESFSGALRAAGLKPYLLPTTRKALLEQLRQLQQKLGRIPTSDDVRAASKRRECASPTPFLAEFGSLTEAKRAAGMKLFFADTSPDAILVQLKRLRRKLGHVPITKELRDACKRGECAHPSTIVKIFGTLKAACRKAGMEIQGRPDRSPQALIAQFKRLGRKLGRVPTFDDVNDASKRNETASTSVFRKNFGSMHDLQHAAGMTPIRRKPSLKGSIKLKRRKKN